MNADDLLVLVKAGFTRNDIMALASGKVSQIQTTTDPQPEPEKQIPTQPQTPTQSQTQNTTNDELQAIKDTIAALQRSNLQAASQPGSAGANNQTSEDVWKNFFEEDKK